MTTLSGGTPDYTASPQQDIRTLINQQSTTLAAGFISSVFPVQQDSHLVVHLTSNFQLNRMWRFTFQYYADAAGTVAMAFRQHVVQSGASYDQIIPCLGAYVKITFEANVYGSPLYTLVVSVDSRSDVAAMWNKGRNLNALGAIAVAGGATVDTDLTPTVGGAGMFYWEWSGAAYTIILLTRSFGLVDTRLVFFTNVTAPAVRQLPITWPDGYCWFRVISGDGAAQTMTVQAVMA